MNELQKRTRYFMDTVGVPMTRFAKHICLSRQSIYRWLSGDLELSPTTIARIDTYLKTFGF